MFHIHTNIKHYLRLLRFKHYLKNILIFVPLFFGSTEGNRPSYPILLRTGYAYILFCLCSSIVYIINDIHDMNNDRKHPVKCRRPSSSRAISVFSANILLFILFIMVAGMSVFAIVSGMLGYVAILWLLGYVVINLLYSSGMKNIPIIDIVILASCYVIRLYYGSVVSQIEVSPWLYLTVLGGAFYLGMGKRRNEIQNQPTENTRDVLKKYNYSFLDKNMHICVAFTEIAYALWTIGHKALLWTVPLIMVIFMKYSLHIEAEDSDANPIDVLLSDKTLMGLGMVYIIIVVICIYIV